MRRAVPLLNPDFSHASRPLVRPRPGEEFDDILNEISMLETCHDENIVAFYGAFVRPPAAPFAHYTDCPFARQFPNVAMFLAGHDRHVSIPLISHPLHCRHL